MRYQLAGSTDRGSVRDHNEDAIDWAAGEDWALAVVADGIGGYNGGEVASTLCVGVFVQEARRRLKELNLSACTPRQMGDLVRDVGRGVNRDIQREQRRQVQLRKMGTTLVAGVTWRDYICVIHAGDSRCYRLRQGQLAILTRDHTYVAEMVARGDFGTEALRQHPLRHVLTRALGRREAFEFDVNTQRVETGDIYLFCSDGLSNSLEAGVLKRVLGASAMPATIATALIDRAKPKADDNISAVVLAL